MIFDFDGGYPYEHLEEAVDEVSAAVYSIIMNRDLAHKTLFYQVQIRIA
jgi:hypothetical protein